MIITFTEYDRFKRAERPVLYQLNLKGFEPSYYYDKSEALKKFTLLKTYLPRCSLRKISYAKMLYKRRATP